MGIVIFMMPKRNDFLNLSDDVWLVGLFGLVHGLNEWVDLFILRGKPFNVEILKIIGALLLPISFIFLVVFSVQVITRHRPGFKWLKFLWIICLTVWALTYIQGKDFLIAGIAARYFICVPGSFLTAFALNLRLSGLDKKQLPKVVLISTQVAIFTFILYGVFSGLLVPKANFLLASIINYPNFSNFFRMPVQFFRMFCAIILAVCFFGITGLFYYEKGKAKLRGGIRRKITLLISLSIFIIAAMGINLGYFWGFNLLRNTVGDEHRKMADILATSISGMFDEDIEQIKAYLTDRVWKNAIRESNLKYETMEANAIQRYLMDMDSKWIEAPDNSPLVREYLNNKVSIELKDILKEEEEKDIAEIFITDRFGGLVASSGKTSDFYQADEEWWQEAFDGGKGKIFIEDIEFDESNNVLAMPFAIPVRDKKGEVIGVCKAVIDIDIFFEPLKEFGIGKTGHALLVNEEGYVVFHEGIEPLSMRFCREEDFENLLKSKSKWMIIDKLHIHTGRIFLAFAEINHPALLERGINWRVFIDQDAEEVFRPLNTLIFQGVVLTGLLIIIMIPLGFIFSRIFVKPIIKLHEATGRIGRGDLDYKIEVKTGDEIEELANSFKDMIASIKGLQVQLIRSEKLAAIGELAAGVAHEINNPLNVISGNAEMLSKESQDQEVKRATKVIIEQVKRAAGITERLLQFSRKIEPKIGRVDINKAIEDTLYLSGYQTKYQNIKIIKRLDLSLPEVMADFGQLQEVFLNIILNAVQAMPNGGELTIKTYAEEISKFGRRKTDMFKQGSEVVDIEFRDTGEGIPEEKLKKIFDPFFSTKEGGTGLGLSICHGIIEAHQGTIDAQSKVGEGTTFIIQLPLQKAKGDA